MPNYKEKVSEGNEQAVLEEVPPVRSARVTH